MELLTSLVLIKSGQYRKMCLNKSDSLNGTRIEGSFPFIEGGGKNWEREREKKKKKRGSKQINQQLEERERERERRSK